MKMPVSSHKKLASSWKTGRPQAVWFIQDLLYVKEILDNALRRVSRMTAFDRTAYA
jgi:hypothetical protein